MLREGAYMVPLLWLSPWQALKRGLLNLLVDLELCLNRARGM
jgi:hypothetical protein